MSDKKAFIIIDLQKDYLWDKRKSMFTYDTQKLVGNVNKAIATYKERGYDQYHLIQYECHPLFKTFQSLGT